jgi:hypothetical protein
MKPPEGGFLAWAVLTLLRVSNPSVTAPPDLDSLRALARKYVWWEQPEQALRFPNRVIAQVMNLGTFNDVRGLIEIVGEDRLREVLCAAEAGQFDARSWHYWHFRLGLTAPDGLPPELPVRAIPGAPG